MILEKDHKDGPGGRNPGALCKHLGLWALTVAKVAQDISSHLCFSRFGDFLHSEYLSVFFFTWCNSDSLHIIVGRYVYASAHCSLPGESDTGSGLDPSGQWSGFLASSGIHL